MILLILTRRKDTEEKFADFVHIFCSFIFEFGMMKKLDSKDEKVGFQR